MVAVVIADWQQAKLGHARIGIDDDAVGIGERGAEFRSGGETVAEGAAAIGNGKMPDAGIGGEQLPILAGADEIDGGIGKAALGGIEDDTGNGHVRAQGDAGEDVDGARRSGDRARKAHAAVTFNEGGAFAGRYEFGEESGVHVAEGGLEAVGEAFGDDAKEGLGTVVAGQGLQQIRRPRAAAETVVEELRGAVVTRNTCQR